MTDDVKTSSTKKVQPSELHQIVPTVYEGRRGHRGLRECTHRLLASAARATCLAEQNRANRQRCQHVSAGKAWRWQSLTRCSKLLVQSYSPSFAGRAWRRYIWICQIMSPVTDTHSGHRYYQNEAHARRLRAHMS